MSEITTFLAAVKYITGKRLGILPAFCQYLGLSIDDARFAWMRKKTALEILLGLSGKISSVMIAGHTPYVSYLANMFIRLRINSLPTSGVATICFDTPEWSDIYSCRP